MDGPCYVLRTVQIPGLWRKLNGNVERIQRTPFALIPGDGFCWMTSILFGCFLFENRELRSKFAGCIFALASPRLAAILRSQDPKAELLRLGVEARWFHPVVDYIKTQIQHDLDNLLVQVWFEHGSSLGRDDLPSWKRDLVEGPLKVGATNYGESIAVRLVEKYFQSCGIYVNVVIHLSNEALVDESDRDPFMNTMYNPEWESIKIVFRGRHYDSLGVWPKKLDQTTRALAEDVRIPVQTTRAQAGNNVTQAEDKESLERIKSGLTVEMENLKKIREVIVDNLKNSQKTKEEKKIQVGLHLEVMRRMTFFRDEIGKIDVRLEQVQRLEQEKSDEEFAKMLAKQINGS